MDIDISRLRQFTNDLLLRLKRDGTHKFELASDYYWDVPAKLRYDKHEEPNEFEMGQLSDDLAFVNAILDGARPPVTFGLVWARSLLRYLGEKIID